VKFHHLEEKKTTIRRREVLVTARNLAVLSCTVNALPRNGSVRDATVRIVKTHLRQEPYVRRLSRIRVPRIQRRSNLELLSRILRVVPKPHRKFTL
jgi:hypothetical protein